MYTRIHAYIHTADMNKYNFSPKKICNNKAQMPDTWASGKFQTHAACTQTYIHTYHSLEQAANSSIQQHNGHMTHNFTRPHVHLHESTTKLRHMANIFRSISARTASSANPRSYQKTHWTQILNKNSSHQA